LLNEFTEGVVTTENGRLFHTFVILMPIIYFRRVTSMIGDNTYLIPLLVLNLTIMRHNIVSLKLKFNHGTTEYRGIFSRYLPWSKISGTAQH